MISRIDWVGVNGRGTLLFSLHVTPFICVKGRFNSLTLYVGDVMNECFTILGLCPRFTPRVAMHEPFDTLRNDRRHVERLLP